MQHCPVCGVRTDGERKRCPLCGHVLPDAPESEESAGVFPVIPVRRTYDMIFRISTFAAVVILLAAAVIHLLYLPHMPIFTMIILGTVGAWITVNVGARKRKNIAKIILWEGIIAVLMCLPWDWTTGWHGWSWGYVLPVVSAGLAVFYFVMGIADSRRLGTYAGYFLITLCGTAAVAVLYFTGHMTGLAAHFGLLSMAVSLVLLLAQVIFRGKHFFSELGRWVHL